MRKITKLRRSVRAISPVISVLLMIAIAVVASLVVYAWIMGFIGNNTSKAGKAVQVQSYALDGNGNLVVYVQNVGQGAVKFAPTSSVYVNDVMHSFQGNEVTIDSGQTASLVTDYVGWAPGQQIKIKVTTADGTFTQTTGTGISNSPGGDPGGSQYTVNFAVGAGSGTTSPSTPQTVNAGSSISISATPATGYSFAQWTATGSITFTDANAASTTATINGAGTITATFSQNQVQYSVNFVMGTGGSTINPTEGAHTYDAGQPVSISTTATAGYHFSSWSATGSITFDNANSASATATINGAGTITANFAANTPVTIALRPNAAGTTTQLNAQGTGTANWDRVDEVTADGTTTYVRGTGDDSWQDDTYNIADQTLSGTITNVRIYIVALESTSSSSNTYARTDIRIGTGSIQYGTQLDLTTSWASYYTDYATKTGNLGSGAWTWTDINNLQIGVGLQSHYSNGFPSGTWRYAECTQVYVEITYIPA